MNSFRRTISGLNNQHLFYNVDFVLFLEGGKKSYNKEEVYNGLFSEETEDILFWKRLFGVFNPNKRIKFKSIGSKVIIKEIADDIINNNLNIKVAMDSEFDEILDQKINHPNIYYTYGYSWENDVWNDIVIKAIIEELSAIEIKNQELKDCFDDFISKIKLAVHADAYLFSKKSSFFPRKSGYMFCVDFNSDDLPTIKEIEITNKITSKGITRRKAIRFGNKFSLNTQKYCFGHFLADYCCQIIIHYLKTRHSLLNVSKDIIYRMSIKKYFDTNFTASSMSYTYYQNQLV